MWNKEGRGLAKCLQLLTEGEGQVQTTLKLADIICEQSPS